MEALEWRPEVEHAVDSCDPWSPEVQVRKGQGQAGLVPRPASSPESSHLLSGVLMAFQMSLESHLTDRQGQAQGQGL